jgi:hypothetical protein
MAEAAAERLAQSAELVDRPPSGFAIFGETGNRAR